ncbi:MAG TPA: hypothetical protein VFP50_18560 [Anaeromyxobacteraceae bacterium]|nr:hypothetical protein [Anaeromyxobacteraceae bacterium]
MQRRAVMDTPLDCQLVRLDRAPTLRGAPSREEPWLWYLRRRFLRAGFLLLAPLRRLVAPAAPQAALPALPAADVEAGDRVRVRPRAEIEATLDAGGALCGCFFAPQMFAWCGREVTVAARVHRFFDERRWRMLRARNMVLLEGVLCDGRPFGDIEGCDRRCYYFWRTEWLERAAARRPGA